MTEQAGKYGRGAGGGAASHSGAAPSVRQPQVAPDLAVAVEEGWERSLAMLQALVRQPSVAAQALGMEECAALTARILREAGAAVAEVWHVGEAAPAVYAEFEGDSERTLLFYNHYDVQPPEPLELWTSPPWDGVVRGGKLYARGVSDDKAPLAARIAAIHALKQVRGSLPCRVKFLVEGEEEIGSVHFGDYVDAYVDRLKADACVWEFGGVDHEGHPELTLGLKGLCYVELEARGASRDQHSSLGAVVPNPAWRLVWALQRLKGTDGTVNLPGFLDGIVPPTPEELRAVERIPWSVERLCANLGIEALTVNGSEAARRALLFGPTCTICGFDSGYQGQGPKTVLPAQARAKVDFRLVPGQDPHDVFAKLRHFLDTEGFADIHTKLLSAEHAYRTPLADPFVTLMTTVAGQAYGCEPRVHVTSAGSGPMYPLGNALGIPMVSAGCGYWDGRAHAPDENIRLSDYIQGIYHMALVLQEFAAA